MKSYKQKISENTDYSSFRVSSIRKYKVDNIEEGVYQEPILHHGYGFDVFL